MRTPQKHPFSLLELLVAGTLLAVLLVPILGLAQQCARIMNSAATRRRALALADDILAWAVEAGADSKAAGSRPPIPPEFKVQIQTRPYTAEKTLQWVNVIVAWNGLRGTRKISLCTLRIRPAGKPHPIDFNPVPLSPLDQLPGFPWDPSGRRTKTRERPSRHRPAAEPEGSKWPWAPE